MLSKADSKIKYAIKIPKEEHKNKIDWKKILREVQQNMILRSIYHHPNIVQFHIALIEDVNFFNFSLIPLT